MGNLFLGGTCLWTSLVQISHLQGKELKKAMYVYGADLTSVLAWHVERAHNKNLLSELNSIQLGILPPIFFIPTTEVSHALEIYPGMGTGILTKIIHSGVCLWHKSYCCKATAF